MDSFWPCSWRGVWVTQHARTQFGLGARRSVWLCNKLDAEEELVEEERLAVCLRALLSVRTAHSPVQLDVHVHHTVHIFVSYTEMSLRAQRVVNMLHTVQLYMTCWCVSVNRLVVQGACC